MSDVMGLKVPGAVPVIPDIQAEAAHRFLTAREMPYGSADEVYSEVLRKLRGVILLGGSIHSSPLQSATGRPVVDLPVTCKERLLDHWSGQCSSLASFLGRQKLAVRLVLSGNSLVPISPPAHNGHPLNIEFTTETDPVEYRGTGGVLRDHTQGYAVDDYILVVNAAQLLHRSLAGLMLLVASKNADAVVVSHADGSPNGCMLIRSGCLQTIPRVGFVDMKEQALPLIARHFHVAVLELEEPAGMSIRTLSDYIEALRRHHRRLDGQSKPADVYAEDWQVAFSITEEGAFVSDGAHIHDSVVLKGARVSHDAVVVRSLICSGANVRRGQLVVDSVVTSAGVRH